MASGAAAPRAAGAPSHALNAVPMTLQVVPPSQSALKPVASGALTRQPGQVIVPRHAVPVQLKHRGTALALLTAGRPVEHGVALIVQAAPAVNAKKTTRGTVQALAHAKK